MTATIHEIVFAAIKVTVAVLPHWQKSDTEANIASADAERLSTARATRNAQ